MKKIYNFILLSLAMLIPAIFAVSCEKVESSTSDEIQQQILDAWIRVNHPDAKASDSGLYYLSSDEGDGMQLKDSLYVFVKYKCRTLDGNYTDYNYEDLAKQLGDFSYSTYYTYDIWYISGSTLTDGINEVLRTMKVGGSVEVAIPPALMESNTVSYYSLYYYSDDDDANENLIYDIQVINAVDDIYQYQIDCLEAYRDANYPGIDSTANGFYFIKTKSVDYSDNPEDTLTEDESINVWYVGRTLDGFVFDTNIEDTARKYRFYDSDDTYDAESISWQADADDLASNSSIVTGFAKGLTMMQRGERAIVFFDSNYGYGESGSSSTSSSIPAYTPLVYEIYVEPEDD
ncbi:MAG: FKBP-type peptidyl-prolyl cis-trans isomerase [Bacteroidales bacterium]|jgi:FKBP-type peptidyl-prolyl cis-trans isomerase|nr:FKBP-type peptidyl-prolyl cis-trans isomerase [Bacteroidales bacterium]MCI2122497.1 FKBP-type peptidyl-prolyl cis-trans isomerase [Bacteroidales bacterium]MCI2145474.1 FKBP-type peptidyl-prolyl cis-trans isomerase [Bacteroidales bacterium]